MRHYNQTKGRILFMLPRMLAFAFAVFLSVFAADFFREDLGIWQNTISLLIHLAPSLIIALLILFSWRKEWIAIIGFALLIVIHIIAGWHTLHWSSYVLIDGPLALVSLLYYAGYRYRQGS